LSGNTSALHRPAFRPVPRSAKGLNRTEQRLERLVHQAVYEQHPAPVDLFARAPQPSAVTLSPSAARAFVINGALTLHTDSTLTPLPKETEIALDHPALTPKGNHFQTLDDNVLIAMLKSFPPEVRVRLEPVCKRFQWAATLPEVWHDQIKADYGAELAVGGKESFRELNPRLGFKQQLFTLARDVSALDGASIADALARTLFDAASRSSFHVDYAAVADVVLGRGKRLLAERPQQLAEFEEHVAEACHRELTPKRILQSLVIQANQVGAFDRADFEADAREEGQRFFRNQPQKLNEYQALVRDHVQDRFG
jgi:hypothetical protein